jgi:anti-sigma B factor antagonist
MPDKRFLPVKVGGRADVLPPAFVCSWTNGSVDSARVHVEGELDIATTPQLQKTLLEPQLQAQLVVLDLRELAFLDNSGVHAIVNASISARQVGRRLVLLRGGLDVDRVFTLTGSAGDVEIVDSDPVLRLVAPDRAS